MSVTIQSVSTSTTSVSDTKVVITKPTGLSVGDLMVAHIAGSNSTSITPPSGWNTIFNFSDPNSGSQVASFWKIAVSGDVSATDFTFNYDNSTKPSGAILRITGHDSTTPINTYSVKERTSSSFGVYTGVTPTVANCLLLLHVTQWGNRGISTYAITNDNPASWTEQYNIVDGSSVVGIACASAIRPQTTATGNATCSISVGAYSVGGLIAISPPVAAGPANLKSLDTNLKANIKTIDGVPIANIKSWDTIV